MSDTPITTDAYSPWRVGKTPDTMRENSGDTMTTPQDLYCDEDAALMKRPSYFKFARDWLLEDPEWRRLENSGDEDGADARAAECVDLILADYRKHIAE